jgi:hypothetical protein
LQGGINGLLAEDHNACYQISTVLVKEYLEMIEGKGDGREETSERQSHPCKKQNRKGRPPAERTSTNLRSELGLNSNDALDPRDLAECLGVRLCTPRDIPGVPKECLSNSSKKIPGVGLL